jgi:poly(A) polymerase
VIGYESRRHGKVEVPLPEFVPDGEVPWHRVWYIRRGDEPFEVRHAVPLGGPPSS